MQRRATTEFRILKVESHKSTFIDPQRKSEPDDPRALLIKVSASSHPSRIISKLPFIKPPTGPRFPPGNDNSASLKKHSGEVFVS